MAVQCRHFLYLSPSVFALGLVCGLSCAPCLPFPHLWHNCERLVSVAWNCAGPTCCSGTLSLHFFVSFCHCDHSTHCEVKCFYFVLFLMCPIWHLFDTHTLRDVTFFATNSFDILSLASSHLLKLCTMLATGTSPNLKRFLRPHCLAPKLLR